MSDSVSEGVWVCGNCGALVPYGTYHFHNLNPVSPWYNEIAARLDRIEEAIRRLETKK